MTGKQRKVKNVVFAVSEAVPFVKTGGLADVCGALPAALVDEGMDVKLFLPAYRGIERKGYKWDRVTPHCLHTVLPNAVQVYLIEHADYFDRDGLYGDERGDYSDNLQRFLYFSSQVLAVLEFLKEPVDVLHCHDWQTALIPALIRLQPNEFRRALKTLLTIHNMAFQGVFPYAQFAQLEFPTEYFHPEFFEFYGKTNLLKGGIVFADRVSTVSPRYAEEILTPLFGCGLEGALLMRKEGVAGILNGIDEEVWNPDQNAFLQPAYNADDWRAGKAANKERLMREMNMTCATQGPLFGFVGRLTDQKGIDMIADIAGEILAMGAGLVIQGQGDPQLQERLEQVAKRYQGHVGLSFAFDEQLAHRIYASSDFFLMPSRFEPCGLSQMISFRYGTIPVVFATGGLADTVSPYNPVTRQGNGFRVERYDRDSFLKVIASAVQVYHEEDHMGQVVSNAFAADFSWGASARAYRNLYQCLLSD